MNRRTDADNKTKLFATTDPFGPTHLVIFANTSIQLANFASSFQLSSSRRNRLVMGAGRLRDAVAGPGYCLYVLTSNRDGRGSPMAGDDQVIMLCPS